MNAAKITSPVMALAVVVFWQVVAAVSRWRECISRAYAVGGSVLRDLPSFTPIDRSRAVVVVMPARRDGPKAHALGEAERASTLGGDGEAARPDPTDLS